MSIRACITCTFYRLTELLPPETYNVIKIEVTSVKADRWFYRTEIIIGTTRYIVRFYARRNQIGEIISVLPHSVQISK